MTKAIKPETIWKEVLSVLENRSNFNTWSRNGGWLSTEFEAQKSGENQIKILKSETRKERKLSSETFEKLASVWYDYLSGKIARGELRKLSHHTSYALPLIKLVSDMSE